MKNLTSLIKLKSISQYDIGVQVLYQLEGSQGALPQLLTTESPSISLSSLTPFTRYQVTVLACNQEQQGHTLCPDTDDSSAVAVITLRTAVGRPGTPAPPQVSFINSSMATIKWSSDFALGAEQAAYWTVCIEKVGENNVTSRKTDDVMIKKVGF